jgi:hypothetical protein
MSIAKAGLGALILSTSLLGACGGSGGGDAGDTTTPEQTSAASTVNCIGNECLASTNDNDSCSYTVSAIKPSSWGKAGVGRIDIDNCGYLHADQLKVCLQQHIGYWQTMEWTCRTGSSSKGYAFDVDSAEVPYYTRGRWYRSWVWGYEAGVGSTTVTSPAYYQN